MVHFKTMLIEVFQWFGVFLVGLITVTRSSFKDDIHRIVVTIVAMALGTLVSYFIKRWLNNPDKLKSMKNIRKTILRFLLGEKQFSFKIPNFLLVILVLTLAIGFLIAWI